MSENVLPRPDEPVVSAFLRHLPSIGVIAAIVALFASVGSGLPRESEEAAAAPGSAAAVALQQAENGAVVPKPESDPTVLAPMTAAEAMLRNAALPANAGANPAASAFHLPLDEIARMRSIDCLTAAVYYEAGLESEQGQRAVAQVVLNRVRHPSYPNTVCGVVFQGSQRITGCQFTFTCDGSLRRTPAAAIWARARRVAEEALGGYVERAVGMATHYHANYVFPYWAPTLAKITQIGAHIFYRFGGRNALSARYAGTEPNIQWRGGFGQAERQLAATATAAVPGSADAVAAAAAAAAAAETPKEERGGTAFLRNVVRRYEPVNSGNATQIIQRNMPAQANSSVSSRWSLTGQGTSGAVEQRPLGRADAQPVILEGVRRRAAPAAPAPAGNSSEPR